MAVWRIRACQPSSTVRDGAMRAVGLAAAAAMNARALMSIRSAVGWSMPGLLPWTVATTSAICSVVSRPRTLISVGVVMGVLPVGVGVGVPCEVPGRGVEDRPGAPASGVEDGAEPCFHVERYRRGHLVEGGA